MGSSKLLPPGEVHLHLLDYTAAASENVPASYVAILSPDELERERRFRFQCHRQQFVFSRMLLRTTLSSYRPEVAPSAWRFLIGTHGKPSILGEAEEDLSFNLSHTEGRVVLAVATVAGVGVDIEWMGRAGDTIEIAEGFFADEEAKMLRALHDRERRRRFIDLWSLKEAYIKARGGGLSIPLASFAFSFPHQSNLNVTFGPDCRDDSSKWHFWNFDIGEEHALSLALKAYGSWQPRMFCSGPSWVAEEVECQVLRTLIHAP